MHSMNRVELMGHVGKKPVIVTSDRGKFANFSLATRESWTDKNSGERKERTEWHNVSVSGDKLVDIIEKSVDKGSYLYIEGSLNKNEWTDKDGSVKVNWRVNVGIRGTVGFLSAKKEGLVDESQSDNGESEGTDDDVPY